jgi:hypothetical protein
MPHIHIHLHRGSATRDAFSEGDHPRAADGKFGAAVAAIHKAGKKGASAQSLAKAGHSFKDLTDARMAGHPIHSNIGRFTPEGQGRWFHNDHTEDK